MQNKPVDLFDYYGQNPKQFYHKKIYSKFCIIFWLLFIILGYFIHPIMSIIGLFLFPIFLIISSKHYYFNATNNRKIVSVLDVSFENYLKKKDEILYCFLNKRFVRLKQLLDEKEDLSYIDHDFPDDLDEINQLSDEERSYFDSIHLEIDKEENSQKYYCILWQQRENPKDDEDELIGLTDVLILEHSDYLALNALIEPQKVKKNKATSIVS
ncbi:hypothetical protein DES39_1295 [Orbus hercynius]|uniref:Uncharacterized protein n=1 Tax=Orbus hercynius TaxID=593135 RepID=A0A495RGA3_9GAMM|nr:hypothetical protein [Orbus hercynius]RKS85878.1 hypothetical protein DES39_1295 [Orbus hercynius]